MSNGLKILSIEHGGWSSSLGVFSYNGRSCEQPAHVGSTALLECSVSKANLLYDQAELARALACLGNNVKMMNHRELTCHIMHVPRYSIEQGLRILNGIALHPIRDEATFTSAKSLAQQNLELISRDATRCCFEAIHQAAWRGSPLGVPEHPSEADLEKLTFENFRAFHASHTVPERSCVVGAGVADHESFVDLVLKTVEFPKSDVKATPLSPNTYSGGEQLVHVTEAPASVKKFEERALTHMGLCFKGVTMDDPDYFSASVIQTLLGGGTSFSSGGPGKGMHTKLFREVINREGWIHGIECVTAWYRDSGLVGLYGQAPHEWNNQLLQTMMAQAATIPERVTEQHWEMAKNQLMSQLILLGETRDILVEEAGKMMLNHGKFLVAEDLVKGTSSLTLNDLRRVCDRMMNDPITLVVYGNTNKLPDVATVSDRLQAAQRQAAKKRKEVE